MKILVLLKQTIGTEEKIVIDNGKVIEDDVEFIINPYDEYAIEEAVKLKETMGAEVTVITVGPPRVESSLRTALAMGADKGIVIDVEKELTDEYNTAKVIAAAIKKYEYDLILGGNMAVDSGSGQVAIRVAEELGIPHLSSITKLSIEDRKAIIERDVEGDIEVIEVNLPFLATAQQGLNEPRYPSLSGILKAKKKSFEHFTITDLNMTGEDINTRTSVLNQYSSPEKPQGKILTGDISQQVSDLVHLLRNESK
ncbi:electron transfer flavoprotein subunit beta [Ammoniphilus sp. 3BR4]|uniref:electron transfer flavoprotein subunit beta/FixA family protein n=1 Tax=Ammoniphilus sp. 3BR4 TaxID=3158265 RepID=UPI0034672264